jgi:effector-binding domain-containing protein
MTTAPDVDVIGLTPTPAVVLERKVRRDRLGQVIDEGIRRVRAAVTAARVPTAGAPFVRYLETGEFFRIEVGLPLDGAHAVPTLRSTVLPGGRAASVWHVGPFGDLGESFSRLAAWVESSGLASGDPWEWYWTSADAEPPRVQIVWPMRDA